MKGWLEFNLDDPEEADNHAWASHIAEVRGVLQEIASQLAQKIDALDACNSTSTRIGVERAREVYLQYLDNLGLPLW